MCFVSTSTICSVKKFEEGTYSLFLIKKAVIMAKGDRKRAKSGSFFQISNKVSPKGKKYEYKPVAGPSSAPDRLQAKGSNSVNSGNITKRLRQRPRPAEDGLVSGNRIVNITKMV